MLKNPPLIEAFCAFELDEEHGRDWDTVSRFYSRVSEKYPMLQPPSSEDEDEDEDVKLLRYNSADDAFAINIRPDALSINQLKNTVDWSTFKSRITEELNIFYDEFRPEEVETIEFRYINRLYLPDRPIHYDEFLNVAPMLPRGRRDMPWVYWNQSVLIDYEDLSSLLAIRGRSSTNNSEKTFSVILDIGMSRMVPIKRNDINAWLDASHKIIEETFIDSLTDISRDSIGWAEETRNDTE